MDIALILTTNLNEFVSDIQMDGPDLQIDHDLETAVIISLFTDRRANSDDTVEGTDRRGWWADTYAEIKNDKIGSRLWLLSREKLTNLTVIRAKTYVTEALKWLIDDKVAESVLVETEKLDMGLLGIRVEIRKPTGVIKQFKYEYAWSQIS